METISNFFKSNYKKIIVIAMIVVFVSIISSLSRNNDSSQKIITKNIKEDVNYIKINGKILKVEIALTPKEQEQGLSNRKELKEDEGMLFVFDHIDKYSFWMKDMNFPIDIIWISEDLHVVFIKKNALPESYPDTFSPTQTAKYVLEVNSGFSEKNDLKYGDRVEFLFP
jgi:hypothetical protein